MKFKTILNKKRIIIIGIIVTCIFLGILTRNSNGVENKGGLLENMNTQTDVDNAEQLFDSKGIPYLKVKNLGDVYQPAGVGVYALKYVGLETYDDDHTVIKDMKKFDACISWLEENLVENQNGDKVWYYKFDNNYNDVFIKSQWYSAFGQALGIEAFVAAYEVNKDKKYLELAKESAKVLFRDVKDGGLLYKKDNDIWFEEVPVPSENPTHILNGNMRTIIALQKLYKASEDEYYKQWIDKGVTTLNKWLPLYDNGYWLGYDLNPKKTGLLFRFNNPYGYTLADLPIDKITLKDPLTNEQIILDVGDNKDAESEIKIAGNDWMQIENIDNKTVRRLKPVFPSTAQEEKNGKIALPGTFFYLKLPSKWDNNLRSDNYELIIDYKDEKAGNVNVQMQSIAPGAPFHDLRDGDLLLTGSGQWKQWKIPIRVSDIHYWVGQSYADRHAKYLNQLSTDYPQLKQWATVANGYSNLVKRWDEKQTNIVQVDKEGVPKQTALIPMFSFDEKGIVRMHISDEKSKYENGFWTGEGVGVPVYSPYLVAQQALKGPDMMIKDQLMEPSKVIVDLASRTKYNWISKSNVEDIKKEVAINWLKNNSHSIKDSLTWKFPFRNVYNDVEQKEDWQSAFAQKYVIDAFVGINDKDTVLKAANAYKYSTNNGGLSSTSKKNETWFEEVPNNSHIMNAHLTSLITLNSVYKYLNNENIKKLYDDGLKSLKENIYRFDTGYWVKYDLNPKKEVLFQIDWLNGEKSPAIESILLENPQTKNATKVDVGSEKAFDSYPNISGTEWSAVEKVDGKNTRRFLNGYAIRQEPIKGATRQNAYFLGVIPEREFSDDFDVPEYKLIIKYFDDNKGEFAIKAQSINQGNALTFQPIRNGIIKCIGDGKWKTAELIVKQQDIGWYMGKDYQTYHVSQLKEIIKQKPDWLLEQYVSKWEYYLKSYDDNKNIIIENLGNKEQLKDVTKDAKVIDSSPMYKGFGVENALDGDPNNDYVATEEGNLPQFFTLQMKEPTSVKKIKLIWESNKNYATDFVIEGTTESGEKIQLVECKSMTNYIQEFDVKSDKGIKSIKLIVNKTVGQQRILLRQISLLKEG